MSILIEAGDPKMKRKLLRITARFLRKILTGDILLGMLKTVWKTVGSIVKLNAVVEIQPIDVLDPQRYVGGLLKTMKWIRQMERLHKKEFGGRLRGSKYDLRWKLVAFSIKTPEDLRMLYDAHNMSDPRAVALQWRHLHRRDRETQYRGRPGRRSRSRALRRRMQVRGYGGDAPAMRQGAGYTVPKGADYGEEPEEEYLVSGSVKEKPVNILKEGARRAILGVSGEIDPMVSPADLLEAGDFNTFYAKMRKGNPKLSRGAAKKMFRKYLKRMKGKENAVTFADVVEVKLKAKARKKLPDAAFADPKTRSYPIHDKRHVQAAIAYARKYKNAAAKKAWPKIKKAAEKYGIDAGEM